MSKKGREKGSPHPNSPSRRHLCVESLGLSELSWCVANTSRWEGHGEGPRQNSLRVCVRSASVAGGKARPLQDERAEDRELPTPLLAQAQRRSQDEVGKNLSTYPVISNIGAWNCKRKTRSALNLCRVDPVHAPSTYVPITLRGLRCSHLTTRPLFAQIERRGRRCLIPLNSTNGRGYHRKSHLSPSKTARCMSFAPSSPSFPLRRHPES